MQYNGQTDGKSGTYGMITRITIKKVWGFINDTKIRFTDKANPPDPGRREDFWIDTLKTHYSQGFNNIDTYH